MHTLFFVLIVVMLIAAFVITELKKKDGPEAKEERKDLPYVKKQYLMTNAERNFFKVLKEAVGDKYYIVPQVALKNIVEVNRYERMKKTYQNKIDRKSLDFVLFDTEYFTPQIVIELDDISHELPARESRDNFVDAIMLKVGIRIKHIKTSFSYNIAEISN
jgi:very-short-patch-repair endonuclease